jgi:transcriptional regulator with XRE-family HTH domain
MSNVTNTDMLVADKLLRMQLMQIRKSKHLTQKDLSKISGLSESCISNIENGDKSSPTLRSLVRYATALNVELYIKFNDNLKEDSKGDIIKK